MKLNTYLKVCIISLLANSIVAYSGFVIILVYALMNIIKVEKDLTNFKENHKSIVISLIYLTLLTFVSVSKVMHILGILIYLICILIYFNIDKAEDTEVLLKYFTIANIIVAIGAGLQYYILSTDIPSGWVDSRYFGSITMRAYGVMKNPNVLAGYLAMCIGINIQCLEDSKNNLLRLVALILSTFTLILTYSRGGWISVIAIAIIIALLKKKKRYIAYILVFVLAICILNGNSGVQRINPANSMNDNSIRYRFEIYKTAILIIKENLLTGVGFFGTSKVLHNYSEIIVAPVNQPHNIILYFLLEVGLIGCILILLILKNIIDRIRAIGIEIIIKDKELVAYLLGFTTIGIHGLIDAVALAPQFLFFIIYILSLFKRRLNMLESGVAATTKLEAYIHGRRI